MKKICFVTTVSMTLKSFVLELAKYLHETGEYDITFICNVDEQFQRELPEYIRLIPVTYISTYLYLEYSPAHCTL